ncbi:hypothetical protein FKM82_014640 [Ascaphus truei]
MTDFLGTLPSLGRFATLDTTRSTPPLTSWASISEVTSLSIVLASGLCIHHYIDPEPRQASTLRPQTQHQNPVTHVGVS